MRRPHPIFYKHATHPQNLREAIATYRGRLMAETKESRRATLMAVCIEYLERCGAGCSMRL